MTKKRPKIIVEHRKRKDADLTFVMSESSKSRDKTPSVQAEKMISESSELQIDYPGVKATQDHSLPSAESKTENREPEMEKKTGKSSKNTEKKQSKIIVEHRFK